MSNQKRKTTEPTRHIMDDGTRVEPLSPFAAAIFLIAIMIAGALI